METHALQIAKHCNALLEEVYKAGGITPEARNYLCNAGLLNLVTAFVPAHRLNTLNYAYRHPELCLQVGKAEDGWDFEDLNNERYSYRSGYIWGPEHTLTFTWVVPGKMDIEDYIASRFKSGGCILEIFDYMGRSYREYHLCYPFIKDYFYHSKKNTNIFKIVDNYCSQCHSFHQLDKLTYYSNAYYYHPKPEIDWNAVFKRTHDCI